MILVRAAQWRRITSAIDQCKAFCAGWQNAKDHIPELFGDFRSDERGMIWNSAASAGALEKLVNANV